MKSKKKIRSLILIPARGGSKRLPRKNLLDLNGKPLIAWTIEQAIESGIGDMIIVSSDDPEILEIASCYSNSNVIAYQRSEPLSTDTATTMDVILDVIKTQQSSGVIAENLVLLQPTSPLRTSEDIKFAHNLYISHKERNSVVGVCRLEHPTAWAGIIDDIGHFKSNLSKSKRSQDYVQEYRPNGAIYICCVKKILKNKSIFSKHIIPFIMPLERSIDIDELIDFQICEYFLSIQT